MDAFSLDLGNKEPSEEDIEALRIKFLSFIKSKHLLLSLPFSSKAVYNAIAHYEFHASVKIRKKEKQSERAFIKYLQRMALNCSPLANFAGSLFCGWNGQVFAPKANFRIDLALAQRKEFFDLCYCDQGLQGIMRHRLNPSLRFEGDGFAYIHTSEDGDNVVRIETSPEFEKLYHSLKKEDFTFAKFDEQSDFDVNDFLEAQLIRPSYPNYSNTKIISEIINSINERFQLGFSEDEIEGLNYNLLDDQKVLALQSAWIKKLNSYAKKLGVSLNDKVYPERVFYLNSALKNCTKPEFNKDLLSAELVSLIEIIEFVQIKGESYDTFEDLNQEVSYPVSQFAYDKIKLNPIEGGFYLELKMDIPASRKPTIHKEPIGVMLQHSSNGKPSLVNVTTAFAKFFAPALPLANDEVNELVKVWVNNAGKNKVVLKDASLHSKNKSHAFMKELDNFGLDFHSVIADRVRVNLVEGVVQAEANGEAVEIVNLGIEEIQFRAPLAVNLQKRSPTLPNIPEFMNGLQESHLVKLNSGISLKPRIESEHLILAWQTWMVSEVEQFPERSNDLGHDMLVLNSWRQELKMPRIISFCFDNKKPNYLDFYNPWSVDIFLRSIKSMETKCMIKELGIPEEIKGIQLQEIYFEFKPSQ